MTSLRFKEMKMEEIEKLLAEYKQILEHYIEDGTLAEYPMLTYILKEVLMKLRLKHVIKI